MAESAILHTRVAAGLGGPWLGLQSYEEKHRPLFFGREAERDELFRLVERGVLTVLYGVSGLGKTSLLNAGLFPKLREASYLPVPIRVRFAADAANPLSQLRRTVAREITAHCTDTPAPGEEETLWEFFHRTPLWNQKVRLLTPVLVFDQFEEVLSLGQKDPRTLELLEAVADLIENYIPRSVRRRLEASQDGLAFGHDKPKAKVIFSLREDYLAQLQDMRALIPSLMRNCYRLRPMSGEQARQAVMGPARQAGLEVTSEVAERIVRIAAGGAQARADEQSPPIALQALEVEPVLLSLFCDELNKKRVERGMAAITQDLAQGERGRILSDFYARCIAAETPEVRRYLEDDLLTKEGHRDTKAVENLPDALKEASERLIDLRLLRREERLGRPYIELIHDVLTEPMLASRGERREREAVEEERRRQQEARSRERAQLEAKAQRSRERARTLALAAAACIALAGVATWHWWQAEAARSEAVSARSEAEKLRLAVPLALRLARQADEVAQRQGDRTLSLLLAIESLRAYPTAEATEVLSRWVLTDKVLSLRAWIKAAAFSPDTKLLATTRGDNVAQVWDAQTGRDLVSLHHVAPVQSVMFGQDGKRLATVSADNTVRLWAAGNGTAIGSLRHPALVTALAFGRGGTRLATGSADGRARVWDADKGNELKSLEHPALVTGLAFSPDGGRLATASTDNAVRQWDAEKGTLLASFIQAAAVTTFAFSPDGKMLAIAGEDNSARVWDAQSGKERISLKHPRRVIAMVFSPDASYLATAAEDMKVRVWDWDSERGKEPAMLSQPAPVIALAFSPDGKRVVTASSDNKLRSSPWRPEDLVGAACSRLSRNLTREERRLYLEAEQQGGSCPNLPED